MSSSTIMEWAAVALAVVAVGVQIRFVTGHLAAARKEVSRYKLYAARDELVRIVAEGRMEESNEDWQAAYVTVTNLLNIHERLDLFAAIRRYKRFHQALRSNHQLRREVELRDRSMRRTSRDVPEFKAALAEIENGFFYAMNRQTSLVQAFVILMVIGVYGSLMSTTSPGSLSKWSETCNVH